MSARRRWAAISIAALAASWAIAPAVVPVYDGAQFPDEPYRWVAPPAGAKPTKPPTVAKAVIPIRNGLSTAGFANSAEQGPQISLYIPATGLQAPPGATVINVTATPMAPSQPLPTDGTIVTNVYRIAASAPPQAAVNIVGKTDNTTPTLQMRAPTSKQPGPVFEYRGSQGWQPMSALSVDGKPVKTLRVGQDIYQTFAPKFGDYALVQLTKAPADPSSGGGGGGGVSWALLGPGIGILALVGIVSAIRFARGRT